MNSIVDFSVRHWRGELPLARALAGPVLGGHLCLLLLFGLWRPSGVVAVAGLVILGAVLIWQSVGTFRAADRSIAGHSGTQLATLAYAAILYIWVAALVQGVGLWVGSGKAVPVAKVAQASEVMAEGDVIAVRGAISLPGYSAFAALSRTGTFRRVELSSEGGNIHAARGMARLVEAQGFDTLVRDKCHSACTLVFMAGTGRHLAEGAQLGFHQYAAGVFEGRAAVLYGDPAEEQAKDRLYLARRGVAAEFLDRIYQAEPGALWLPEPDDLRRARVLTE